MINSDVRAIVPSRNPKKETLKTIAIVSPGHLIHMGKGSASCQR